MHVDRIFPVVGHSIPYVGHRHFWQRAMARREFIRTSAGVTALVLGAGIENALPAGAAPPGLVWPKPIPGGSIVVNGVQFHVNFPVFGNEVSTITDFNGFVAAAETQGTGTGTNTNTGETSTLTFDADVRLMQGVYVGVDGKNHNATFGFV
jgi:hypothetical protein